MLLFNAQQRSITLCKVRIVAIYSVLQSERIKGLQHFSFADESPYHLNLLQVGALQDLDYFAMTQIIQLPITIHTGGQSKRKALCRWRLESRSISCISSTLSSPQPQISKT
jgi:hypothetical protein